MSAVQSEWKFHRFGLIVTGKGEERFITKFFGPLMAWGNCTFSVIHRMGQRSPRASTSTTLTTVGTTKKIPDRDATEIGIPSRIHLQKGSDRFVIVLDDMEYDRLPQASQVYARYRKALDVMLGPYGARASVHFLVPMLEAYYFADAASINAVLKTSVSDHLSDVEEIRNPKSRLKEIWKGFDEIEHGFAIVSKLDMSHVLSNPRTCAWLRCLFAWCTQSMSMPFGDEFCLSTGIYSITTGPQLNNLDP